MTKWGTSLGVQQMVRNPLTAAKILLVAAVLIFSLCFLLVTWHQRSRLEETRLLIGSLQNAVEMYTKTNGRLPDNLNQLLDGAEAFSVIRPWQPRDVWGIPFLYTKIDGDGFEIRSAGLDKRMNTDDDLTNDR